ncbi:MAG: nuclear transport factor 2 family protein [Marinicellaceae bacterium]
MRIFIFYVIAQLPEIDNVYRKNMLIQQTIKHWHELLNKKDPTLLKNLLDDDVVFHSPVLYTPQKGKALTTMYLSAALHVLAAKNFTYKREVLQNNIAVLEFDALIDGIIVNGIDIIECNEKGKITDFKVMVRPLKGLQMIQQKMFQLLNNK